MMAYLGRLCRRFKQLVGKDLNHPEYQVHPYLVGSNTKPPNRLR